MEAHHGIVVGKGKDKNSKSEYIKKYIQTLRERF